MDPVTQTLTGAIVTQAVMAPRLGRWAALMGAAGGVLADADVFLTPLADPALPFALHRHFTHALVFIPVGGLIAAAPFMLFRKWRERAGVVAAATTVGYATHALLDNCTSYGTHLWWPFTSARTAWDAISIIDPIYSLLLLIGVVAALVVGKAAPARVFLALALAYMGLGFVQHHRVSGAQERLAELRGHDVIRGRVMPTLGNIIVWRSVYEHDGRLYADAVRLVPWARPTVKTGTSIARFTPEDVPDGTTDPERVTHVFARFSAFADGFTAATSTERNPSVSIGDVRYSFDTAGFEPIWGLRIDSGNSIAPVAPANYAPARADALAQMWRDIVAPGDAFRPIDEPSRPSK